MCNESQKSTLHLCPTLLHDVNICRLGGIWTNQGAGIAIVTGTVTGQSLIIVESKHVCNEGMILHK